MTCAPPGAGLLFAAVLGGCGAQPGGQDPGCPSDLPAACPAPAPGFRADIAPLFQRRCLQCHGAGGVAQPRHDFTAYAGIFAQRGAILNQVYACLMPPQPAPQPDPAERAALLAWLVCGAPDG